MRTFLQDTSLLYRRGLLHLKLSDKIRAKEDMSIAKRLGANITESAEALAEALGIRDEAQQLLASPVEEALKLISPAR